MYHLILMSAVLRCPRTVTLLMLLLMMMMMMTPPSSSSFHRDLPGLGDLSPPYDSIFSPLLKALAEHGGSGWTPGLRGKAARPEGRYVTYLTDAYEKTSGAQRSPDGGRRCNTVRLIKPQDECFGQSNRESFMQDLSYNLDQVRRREDLLKSALLYGFDHVGAAPAHAACYVSVQEQESHCHLCSPVQYAVNFTRGKNGRNARSWVEVDVTSFLRPLFKLRRRKMHLLINVTCHEEERAGGGGRKDPPEFTLRSPPLLLYLTDTSKTDRPRMQENPKALQSPVAGEAAFHKQTFVKSETRFGRKRRWKRDSPKSKRGDKGLDTHLPELLPSSEFPTNDCALYDFRVRFSQLKLDHWIVFPPKYNPRYCRGICPRTMGFIYGSPVHTMVQNIIYEKLDSSVPRPSCIPSHYSPLSVMIFEEDGSYVYKEFEDMVATRCTCR